MPKVRWAYHGTETEPAEVRHWGLVPMPNDVSGRDLLYFTTNFEKAEDYGQYVYRFPFPRDGVQDDANDVDFYVTPSVIPPRVIEYIDANDVWHKLTGRGSVDGFFGALGALLMGGRR